MPHVDQSQPFEKRLADFGPELGAFLGKVWKARAKIDLANFEEGMWDIYGMYSGSTSQAPFKLAVLKKFVAGLKKLAGKYAISPQSGVNGGVNLSAFDDVAITVYAGDLWGDFFHVLASPAPAKDIRARVYVHASSPDASLEIMKVIVGQFGVKDSGLWEVKTCGPGAVRLDTIVAYLYDEASASKLVALLNETAAKKKAWFIDKLPPLVKNEGPGIGSADEPPELEIYKGQGDRHSFGSFFSTLCWIALKTTPNVLEKEADGRHLLDNMLYSLRLLEVDPAKPQRFPAAKKLAAWYQEKMK
jgi:hypothetical protein